RNDYLVNLFMSVIETILFFNPFMLLLAKAIKRERENCCDDFVIQYRYDPQSYASALLRLEQLRRGNLKLAMGAVSGKKQLLNRIKRITNDHRTVKQFNYGQKLFALLIVTFIICSIAWLSPGEKKKELPGTVTLRKGVAKTGQSIVENKKTEPAFSAANLLQSAIETTIEKWVKEDKPADSKKPEVVDPRQLMPETVNDKLENNEYLFKLKNPENSFAFNFNTDHPEAFFTEDFLKGGVLKLLSDYVPENLNIHVDIKSLNKALRDANKNINIINLKKMEGDVEKSLALLKVKRIAQADMKQYMPQNFDNLSDAQNFKKGNPGFKIFNQLKSSLILLDSMKNLQDEIKRAQSRRIKTWKKISVGNDLGSDYPGTYYDYSYEPVPLSPPAEEFKRLTTDHRGTISITRINRNGVDVERVEARSNNPKNKASFHLSISNDSKAQSVESKIITIEVKENE
ncbi:MAG: M56 family metallopeptidase, partial [Ginsengibacter sp.]